MRESERAKERGSERRFAFTFCGAGRTRKMNFYGAAVYVSKGQRAEAGEGCVSRKKKN